MHTAIVIAIVMLIVFYPEIRNYFYSKKSPDQKYADYRKFVNSWNVADYY